jgi:hypothetical protein
MWLLGHLFRAMTHETRDPSHPLAAAIGTERPTLHELPAAFKFFVKPFESGDVPVYSTASVSRHLQLLHPLLYDTALWLQRYSSTELAAINIADLHFKSDIPARDLNEILVKARDAHGSFLHHTTVPLSLASDLSFEHPARVVSYRSNLWRQYLLEVLPVGATVSDISPQAKALKAGLDNNNCPTVGSFPWSDHGADYIFGRSYISSLATRDTKDQLDAFLKHADADAKTSSKWTARGSPDYAIGRLQVLGRYLAGVVAENRVSLSRAGAETTAVILAQFHWFMQGFDNDDTIVQKSMAHHGAPHCLLWPSRPV